MNSEPCFTGFRGVRRDANMLVPDIQQPPADPDIDSGDPCPEDEECFESRPDAGAMEEAIGWFMDGMEAQERSGFKDLHRFLERLPVPTPCQGLPAVSFQMMPVWPDNTKFIQSTFVVSL